MKKLVIATGLALALLSGCSDGHYRYPCQDPANWESPDCNPPICNATGTCTKDLLPEEDMSNGSIPTQS